MASNNSTTAPSSQQTPPPHMTTGQAINQARLALSYILWGDPPVETFDPHRLERALAVLGQSITVEPLEAHDGR